MKALVLAHGQQFGSGKILLPAGKTVAYVAEEAQFGLMNTWSAAVSGQGGASLEVDVRTGPAWIPNYSLAAEADVIHLLLGLVAAKKLNNEFKLYYPGDGVLPEEAYYCTTPRICREAGAHSCEGILGLVPEAYIVGDHCRATYLRSLIGHYFPAWRPEVTDSVGPRPRVASRVSSLVDLIERGRDLDAMAILSGLGHEELSTVVTSSKVVKDFWVRNTSAEPGPGTDAVGRLPGDVRAAMLMSAWNRGTAEEDVAVAVPGDIAVCLGPAWQAHFLYWLQHSGEVALTQYELILYRVSDTFESLMGLHSAAVTGQVWEGGPERFEAEWTRYLGEILVPTQTTMASLWTHDLGPYGFPEEARTFERIAAELQSYGADLADIPDDGEPSPATRQRRQDFVGYCRVLVEAFSELLEPGGPLDQDLLPKYQAFIRADAQARPVSRGPW